MNEELSNSVNEAPAAEPAAETAPDAPATADKPTLRTIEDAKKAREAELAALPVPAGCSVHVLSTTDFQPVRPYVEKLDNGTVIQRN